MRTYVISVTFQDQKGNYYKENEFLKIWDYEFSTNNFGLVQKSDIYSDKDSILFLGDSFTEGQGATPWIDNFEGIISSYQVINCLLYTSPSPRDS